MCERKTILVRGESRRMMGIKAVTVMSQVKSLVSQRPLHRRKTWLCERLTLRVVDDGDIQPPQRAVLASPEALEVVRGPGLEERLVVVVEEHVLVGNALKDVLCEEVSAGGELGRSSRSKEAKRRTWNLRLLL